MTKLGIVGYRGMVGSVLVDRMTQEGDFDLVETSLFSTSQAGQPGPDLGWGSQTLFDANNIDQLRDMDVIISCQGGSYTKSIHPALRASNWKGYWIDAASALRMSDDALIVLDPINGDKIKEGLAKGVKDYIGGNCTVSLMLMAIGGLFREGLVEWVSAATYQAASGAGAKNMKELVHQMKILGDAGQVSLAEANTPILDLDATITNAMRSSSFPCSEFGAPLAASLLPWIDSAVDQGQTREEWKGYAETNKILGLSPQVPVDGICVRVGSMRCHSQAFTIKLKKDVPLNELESIMANTSDWTEVIANNKEETIHKLTPTYATGTLKIPVGRIHKMNLGPNFLSAFTVGDQLLWGAAEPLRRMLRIVLDPS